MVHQDTPAWAANTPTFTSKASGPGSLKGTSRKVLKEESTAENILAHLGSCALQLGGLGAPHPELPLGGLGDRPGLEELVGSREASTRLAPRLTV